MHSVIIALQMPICQGVPFRRNIEAVVYLARSGRFNALRALAEFRVLSGRLEDHQRGREGAYESPPKS